MAGRRIVIAWGLACGCGRAVGNGDGSQSGSEASSATESAATSVTASESTPSDTSGVDTGIVEDACAQGDPAACPEGCYSGEAWRVVDDACTTSSVAVCLPGGPKPGLPITTYWAIAPSGPVFAEYGSPDCSVAAQPEGWRECMGEPDEPADCACFCQNGYCRGDEDRRVLEACDASAACDTLPIIARQGAADHEAERCVLEHLRDRVPGLYEIVTTDMLSGSYIRLYVVGDRVWRIQEPFDDVGDGCPKVSAWTRAELCTLAPADFFATCLDVVEPEDECVRHLDAWVLDCGEQAPSCG